ncbi:methyl-CpG-binding domain-containing protein 2-like [Olea europaea var. sylvestris]|uniref:methyl-CpG-binding domain-containing protein 2-like n=1 Tax=Olea europaea var. sylvestris TaxID=158386 RepID=UPI000C1D2B03|nr:methyl-CpG-binding domain-containing protein 2-like [Olea europaea var. sylvestris]
MNMEGEPNVSNSSNHPGGLETTPEVKRDVAFTERIVNNNMEDEGNQSSENAQKQLVPYDPAATGTGEMEPVSGPIDFPNRTPGVLRSIGAFAVQCANCFKWRLIPSQDKYEEIREHIIERPFLCETAREWQPEISCNDQPDIAQDGSRLWAIDKPNIARPPPGWQRILRIRGERSTKFADVYYLAPSGKRLRSVVEVQRYLNEHPEYKEVSLSQFSFQIPRPLQQNYVSKRPRAASYDTNDDGMPECLDPSKVNPLARVASDVDTDLQLSGPGLSAHYFGTPGLKPENQSAKRKRTPSKRKRNDELA